MALIDGGLGYLRPVWANADWRLYRVARARTRWGLGAALGVRAMGPDAFTVDPGAGPTSIRWTPFWSVTAGVGLRERGRGRRDGGRRRDRAAGR